MVGGAPQPVNSPEVWNGSELSRSGGWWTELGSSQVEELKRATASSSGANGDAPPFSITREDFPLPVTAEVQHEVRSGRSMRLLRGLPVADLDAAGAARMLWGIGSHIGAAEAQDASGSLLHEVRDTGRDLDEGNVRYYQTNRAIGFHNDGADAFMLLCINPAAAGGESRMVSATAVFNELLRRAPDAAALLQQPFYFDLRGQHADGAPPYQTAPIFTFYAGRMHALYKRGYIDSGQRLAGVPPLTPEQVAALDLLDELCDELALDFALKRGDLLVGNNYLVLHDRRAFPDGHGGTHSDATSPLRSRLMLRLWLSIPGGHGVPPALADTREFRHSHARHLQWGAGEAAGS